MSLVSATRSTQLLNCTSAIVLELQEKTIQYSHQSRLQTGELHELLRKPMNIHHVLQTCTMITGGGGIPPLPAHAQTDYNNSFVCACCCSPTVTTTPLSTLLPRQLSVKPRYMVKRLQQRFLCPFVRLWLTFGLALSGHLTCAGLMHQRVTARRVHVGGGKISCFGRLTLMARWVASLGRVADSRLLVFVLCCNSLLMKWSPLCSSSSLCVPCGLTEAYSKWWRNLWRPQCSFYK